MGFTLPSRLRALAVFSAIVVAAALLLAFQIPQVAHADSAPQAGTPATVTTDSLPTVQINGVVWSQVIIGNTVYAGGEFTTAQPAGAAAGVNTTAVTNLIAYNLTTGVMIPSFIPNINGAVNTLAASPDGSILYIGGKFSSVNGATRYRLAAFSTATGALTSFAPAANAYVSGIAATATTVYFGGNFTAVGSSTRNHVAAVKASNGALLPFTADAEGGIVKAIVISPDQSKIVVGGAFTTMNGSSNPGYGLAALDAVTGASLPWAVNNDVRDAGANSAIESLTSDGDSVYGTGYVFGDGGNLEGAFRASWSDGTIVWIEDCHGDSYSVTTTGDDVYIAGHMHYCGNSGGQPQTSPNWTYQRGMAWTKEASSHVITPDPYGYYNWAGFNSPNLLNWWPDINTGTYTGQNQGAWSNTSNADYVLYAGEFTEINGQRQQGLARFAVSSIAPNKDGPRVGGANWVPTAVSLSSGTVRLSWLSNYDRDNQYLTYTVIRDGVSAKPIYTTVGESRIWWDRPSMGFVDTGLTPGSTHTYTIKATDPFGNSAFSQTVTATVSSAAPSAYVNAVKADGATDLWRLNESAGTSTAYDWAGFNDMTVGAGVTRGASGSNLTDGSTATTYPNDASGITATQSAIPGPNTFSIEAWFKTTSTTGGKIVGFGDSNTTTSSNYDRHIYMDPSGTVYFGVYPGSSQTLQSAPGLNDGQWHYVVANLSSSGMQLYVDGRRVGQRTDVTSGQSYSGYWRIGGDSTWAGDNDFDGQIDDVAIYPQPLSAATINNHLVLSGRPSVIAPAPSDAYGAAVYNDSPDLFWRLGDISGSTAADSSSSGLNTGTYYGGVTQGVSGGVTPASSTAVAFNGVDGLVSSNVEVTDPEVYTEEVWFNTTTTSGGKLMGFGNSQTGTSSSYDRHIYMQNNGQLSFGTYTGQLNVATTSASYNDGKWHYAVATQSSAGLQLYVDGVLAAQNPTTSAQDYAGYWRVGGDTSWSGGNFFNGKLQDAAVYSTALSAADIANHYALGLGNTPNVPPVAAFTPTVSNLTANVDASASTDPDGTIASYAWNFGDGATATGVTASHSYATAGSYNVTLTVTDNDGAVNSTTQSVSVAAANLPPTAAFTSTTQGLAASFDGTTSSDPDGTLASYAWSFGDGQSGTGATASHSYAIAGTYPVTLTVTDNDGAANAVTKSVTVVAPNLPPVAAFAASPTNLVAAFDASASTDADGTISSYSWNFGDGTTGTGVTTNHSYASPGTYSVILTVTDNGGATNAITHSVTVAAQPANVPPVASFTSSNTDLSANLDGSGSTDADGTIAGYSWNFGDGSTGVGATVTHAYTAAGTYTVTLTVTDNGGATNAVSKPVTVTAPTAPGAPYVSDTFSRTTTSSLGSADLGGAWTTTSPASAYSVSGGTARFRAASAGVTLNGYLAGISSTDSDSRVTVSTDQAPTGTGAYIMLTGRKVGSDDYHARILLNPSGVVQLQLQRTGTTLKAANIAGLTYAAGDKLQLRLQVVGTSPTTIQAKVWKLGTTEPSAWQLTTTDSTASLQVAGSVGLSTYLAGSATTVPLTTTFDDYSVQPSGSTTPPPPANVPPVASFTSTANNLAASFDGSGSTDSDGTVASYSWNFGDGTTGTGATTSHNYAAAGTYTVALTVTDNGGATNTVTKPVAVTLPLVVGSAFAADAFGRTLTSGLGTADLGGLWTLKGAAANFSVGGGVGQFKSTAAGQTFEAYLGTVSSTDTDVEVTATPQQAITGTAAYISLIGRRIGTVDYRARAVIDPTGKVVIQIQENGVTMKAVTVAGLTYSPGDSLDLRLQVFGTSPTTVQAKVWKVGATEPAAWQVSTTDSTAGLQAAGSVGIGTYLAASATTLPFAVSFDNLTAAPH